MATPLTKRLASEPVSKVEVHISCDKLMDKDITSKSDPCCLLYVMTDGRWVEVHSSSLYFPMFLFVYMEGIDLS